MRKILLLGIMLLIALSNIYAQEINSITPKQPQAQYLIIVKYPDGRPVANTLVEIMDGHILIGQGRTNQDGFMIFDMEGQEPTHNFLIRVQPCGQKLESYPSEGPRYVYITTGYDPC